MSNNGLISFTVDDCEDKTVKNLLKIGDVWRIKFTFAISTGLTGKKYKGKTIASWKQLAQVVKRGHLIASHSVSHVFPETILDRLRRGISLMKTHENINFRYLTSRSKYIFSKYHHKHSGFSLKYEIEKSKKEIEQELNIACTDFYSPGGVVSSEISRLVKWSGYELLRTSKDGYNNPRDFSPFDLKVKTWDKFTTAEQANAWVLDAEKSRLWLIESLHEVVDNPKSLYDADSKEFIKHLDFIKQRNIKVDLTVNICRELLRKQYDNNFRHFEKEADKKTYFLGFKSFYLFKKVKNMLPNNPKILSLGCGDGADLLSIRQDLGNVTAELVGTDISLSMCKATTRTLLVPTLWADSRNLNICDLSFDLVVDRNTSSFIEDDMEFIKEQNRILKKGGVFILSATLKNWYGVYIYRKNGQFVLDPAIVNTYSSEEQVLRLLNCTGFTVLYKHKFPIEYPVIDLVFRFFELLKIGPNDSTIYLKHPFLSFLRRVIKIPIPGFWKYEVVARKVKNFEPVKPIHKIKSSQYKVIVPSGSLLNKSSLSFITNLNSSIIERV